MMRYLIYILLLLPSISYAFSFGGDTYTADSCSYADVSSKIADSTISGDVLNIPAGSCDWAGSELTITKGIHISGAGTNASTGTRLHNAALRPDVDDPNSAWIGNLYIRSNGGTAICAYGSQTNLRIYNNFLTTTSGYTVTVGSNSCSNNGTDYTLGLIDNNEFIYTSAESSAASAILVQADTPTLAFARPTMLGTVNTVVIEDNLIDRYTWAGGTHVWISDSGTFTVRYNTFKNMDIDVHGHCSWYGAREWEIYENSFECEAGVDCSNMTVLRGATGVFWNNTFTHNGTNAGYFRVYDNRLTGNCHTTIYSGDTECTNSGVYTDEEYPLEYGFGRGEANTLQPIYTWGNSWNASSLTSSEIYWYDGANCDAIVEPDMVLWGTGTYAMIESGRDWYFQTAQPNYSPLQYPHPLRNEACQAYCGDRSVFKGGSFKGGSMK